MELNIRHLSAEAVAGGVNFKLVGLHMKDILRDKLLTFFRNWLALGKAVCPGPARP